LRLSRPLKVVLYAAFIGMLLASYFSPLQQIFERRAEIPVLQEQLSETRDHNRDQKRFIEDLKTPEGVERVARQDYGMIRPGEKVYLIPQDGE
jgi:cell division protein FtsB